jgi:hypothetical protein
MMQLTPHQLRILEESYYSRDCGREHSSCDTCLGPIHAGQLCWTSGRELHHTRCLLPGLLVHQLHDLVWNGRAS